MAKSQYEITDRLSNCSVCFELYEGKGDRLPRILPCFHSFCEKCINDLIEGNVFHCPECKVPHPAENGSETFKLNKYVLSNVERTAMATTNPGEICKMLLHKLEAVRSCFDEKEVKLRQSREEMINLNKTCSEEFESRKEQILKDVVDRFKEMEKEMKKKTESESKIIDEKLDEIGDFKEKLELLEKKIEKSAQAARDDCAVELEQLKNMAELPMNKYQYCEYHPENGDPEYFKRMCGYLSAGQQDCKETHSFSLDKVFLRFCLINDDEVAVAHAKETVDGCTGINKLCNYKLTKYNLKTGTELDKAKLWRKPNGLVSVSLAGRPCVAVSYHVYHGCRPDSKRIEFRDANNLRLTLLSYKPQVRPGCLAVAPPLLLFYEEIPNAEWYKEHWKQHDYSGEVRTLDCSTNPPKPGENVFHTSARLMYDMCVTKENEKQLIVCCKSHYDLSAHNTETDQDQWSKSKVNGRNLRPVSITTNSRGHLFQLNHESDRIEMFCSDGRYMGKLMNLQVASFLRWNDNMSSLVVAQYKDNVSYDKNHQKWTISVFKVD